MPVPLLPPGGGATTPTTLPSAPIPSIPHVTSVTFALDVASAASVHSPDPSSTSVRLTAQATPPANDPPTTAAAAPTSILVPVSQAAPSHHPPFTSSSHFTDGTSLLSKPSIVSSNITKHACDLIDGDNSTGHIDKPKTDDDRTDIEDTVAQGTAIKDTPSYPGPFADSYPSDEEWDTQDPAEEIYRSRFKPMMETQQIIDFLTDQKPQDQSTESLYQIAEAAQKILTAWQDEYLEIDARVIGYSHPTKKPATGGRLPLDPALFDDLKEAELYNYAYDARKGPGNQNPVAQRLDGDSKRSRRFRQRKQLQEAAEPVAQEADTGTQELGKRKRRAAAARDTTLEQPARKRTRGAAAIQEPEPAAETSTAARRRRGRPPGRVVSSALPQRVQQMRQEEGGSSLQNIGTDEEGGDGGDLSISLGLSPTGSGAQTTARPSPELPDNDESIRIVSTKKRATTKGGKKGASRKTSPVQSAVHPPNTSTQLHLIGNGVTRLNERLTEKHKSTDVAGPSQTRKRKVTSAATDDEDERLELADRAAKVRKLNGPVDSEEGRRDAKTGFNAIDNKLIHNLPRRRSGSKASLGEATVTNGMLSIFWSKPIGNGPSHPPINLNNGVSDKSGSDKDEQEYEPRKEENALKDSISTVALTIVIAPTMETPIKTSTINSPEGKVEGGKASSNSATSPPPPSPQAPSTVGNLVEPETITPKASPELVSSPNPEADTTEQTIAQVLIPEPSAVEGSTEIVVSTKADVKTNSEPKDDEVVIATLPKLDQGKKIEATSPPSAGEEKPEKCENPMQNPILEGLPESLPNPPPPVLTLAEEDNKLKMDVTSLPSRVSMPTHSLPDKHPQSEGPSSSNDTNATSSSLTVSVPSLPSVGSSLLVSPFKPDTGSGSRPSPSSSKTHLPFSSKLPYHQSSPISTLPSPLHHTLSHSNYSPHSSHARSPNTPATPKSPMTVTTNHGGSGSNAGTPTSAIGSSMSGQYSIQNHSQSQNGGVSSYSSPSASSSPHILSNNNNSASGPVTGASKPVIGQQQHSRTLPPPPSSLPARPAKPFSSHLSGQRRDHHQHNGHNGHSHGGGHNTGSHYHPHPHSHPHGQSRRVSGSGSNNTRRH